MAPPLLRWTLSNVTIGQEESDRLHQEAYDLQSFIKQVRRVLISTSGGPNVQLAAQLVSYLAHQNQMEITALFAQSNKKSPRQATSQTTQVKQTAADAALDVVAQAMDLPENASLQTKVQTGLSKAEVLLSEARKGYDLIVLGASQGQSSSGALFSLFVDRVIQEAPCATLVVKTHLPIPQGEVCALPPQAIRHILVPTIGSESSKQAVELASTIASQIGAKLTLIHVMNQQKIEYLLYERRSTTPAQEIAQQIVAYHTEVAENFGANVQSRILEDISPERAILNFAQNEAVDLIVLGSTIRSITGRVFFGHRVDALLNQVICPVAVLSSV